MVEGAEGCLEITAQQKEDGLAERDCARYFSLKISRGAGGVTMEVYRRMFAGFWGLDTRGKILRRIATLRVEDREAKVGPRAAIGRHRN